MARTRKRMRAIFHRRSSNASEQIGNILHRSRFT
jgi:hypothetical protein